MFFGRTAKNTAPSIQDQEVLSEALPEALPEALAPFSPIISYLKEVNLAYTLLPQEKLISFLEQEKTLEIAAKVLQDNRGMLMVLMPAQYLLDYTLLAGVLKRELLPFTSQDANPTYPLPDYYQLDAVIDESLSHFSFYYFHLNGTDQYLCFKSEDFFFCSSKIYFS